jgi:hypothetical protein
VGYCGRRNRKRRLSESTPVVTPECIRRSKSTGLSGPRAAALAGLGQDALPLPRLIVTSAVLLDARTYLGGGERLADGQRITAADISRKWRLTARGYRARSFCHSRSEEAPALQYGRSPTARRDIEASASASPPDNSTAKPSILEDLIGECGSDRIEGATLRCIEG